MACRHMQLRRPPPCSYKRGTVVFFHPVARPQVLIHLAFCSPTRGVLQMGNTVQLPESPEKCHNVLLGIHAEYVQRRRCEGIPDKCRALWNSSAPKARRLFGGPNILSKDRRVSFASNSTLRPSCSHLSQSTRDCPKSARRILLLRLVFLRRDRPDRDRWPGSASFSST